MDAGPHRLCRCVQGWQREHVTTNLLQCDKGPSTRSTSPFSGPPGMGRTERSWSRTEANHGLKRGARADALELAKVIGKGEISHLQEGGGDGWPRGHRCASNARMVAHTFSGQVPASSCAFCTVRIARKTSVAQLRWILAPSLLAVAAVFSSSTASSTSVATARAEHARAPARRTLLERAGSRDFSQSGGSEGDTSSRLDAAAEAGRGRVSESARLASARLAIASAATPEKGAEASLGAAGALRRGAKRAAGPRPAPATAIAALASALASRLRVRSPRKWPHDRDKREPAAIDFQRAITCCRGELVPFEVRHLPRPVLKLLRSSSIEARECLEGRKWRKPESQGAPVCTAQGCNA